MYAAMESGTAFGKLYMGLENIFYHYDQLSEQ